MKLKVVLFFAMVGITAFGVQAEAQTPCPELVRLRAAATEAWKLAMRAPQPERCAELLRASRAAAAARDYAGDNRASCDVSVALLNQLERGEREAVQARDNVCAGRPLRPYPPEIIRR